MRIAQRLAHLAGYSSVLRRDPHHPCAGPECCTVKASDPLKKDRGERENLERRFNYYPNVVFDKHPNTASIQFGKPLTLAEIGLTKSPPSIEIIKRMEELVKNPPQGPGISAL